MKTVDQIDLRWDEDRVLKSDPYIYYYPVNDVQANLFPSIQWKIWSHGDELWGMLHPGLLRLEQNEAIFAYLCCLNGK